MTVTLNGGISASAIHLLVNAPVDDPAPVYKIDNEAVLVRSTQELEADGALKLVPNYTRWTVERGQFGTTKATHADGATMTPLYPQVGNPAIDTGGGPAEAGTVVEDLTGTETAYGHFYRGDEDPEVDFGAELLPGDMWTDTSPITGTGFFPVYARKERNEANDGWQFVGLSAVDALGNLTALVSCDPTGQITVNGYAPDGTILASIEVKAEQSNVTVLSFDALGAPTGGFVTGVGVFFLGPLSAPDLPTVDPTGTGAGQLWNDSGTVKVTLS